MKRTEPIKLDNLLDEFVNHQKRYISKMEGDASMLWLQVAGKKIAVHCTNVFLKDRVLHIKVSSAVIKNEIIMRRQHYIKELNLAMGFNVISFLHIE